MLQYVDDLALMAFRNTKVLWASWWFMIFAHVGEAAYVYHLLRTRSSASTKSTILWVIQTLMLGFPSTNIVKARLVNKSLKKAK